MSITVLRKKHRKSGLSTYHALLLPYIAQYLVAQLLVSFADTLNNPSLTFCPAIIAAFINCALIGKIYKKNVLSEIRIF